MPSFWAMSVKWNLAHLPWQEYIIWQGRCAKFHFTDMAQKDGIGNVD